MSEYSHMHGRGEVTDSTSAKKYCDFYAEVCTVEVYLLQWVLVYPTTMCRINWVLNKSGRIVYSVWGFTTECQIKLKCLDKPVLDISDVTVHACTVHHTLHEMYIHIERMPKQLKLP